MSDSYTYLFCPDVACGHTAAAKRAVLMALQDAGLIARVRDDDTVLGDGEGYPPAPHAPELFSDPERIRQRLMTLRTRGIGVVEGFGFTGWALNQFETVTCPNCGPQPVGGLLNAIWDAADRFHKTTIIPPIACPCGATRDARAFRATPELTFTHLGFQFWNWPAPTDRAATDRAGWKIDIPALMSRAAQSPVRESWGRI